MGDTTQVNFKADPQLKSAFMREAKNYYKIPTSVLFSKFMEMVASRSFEFTIEADDTYPAFYETKDMVDVDESIEDVIASLEKMT
jgi:hypothetical protein